MTLKLYNTLTREKEEFVPQDPGIVILHVCVHFRHDYRVSAAAE